MYVCTKACIFFTYMCLSVLYRFCLWGRFGRVGWFVLRKQNLGFSGQCCPESVWMADPGPRSFGHALAAWLTCAKSVEGMSPFLFWKSQRAHFCLPQAASVHRTCMVFKLSSDKHPECQTHSRSFPSSFSSDIWKTSSNIWIAALFQGHRLLTFYLSECTCEEGCLYLMSGT